MNLDQNVASPKLKTWKLMAQSKSNGYKNLFPIVWNLLVYGEA